jgi:hypothetical protein
MDLSDDSGLQEYEYLWSKEGGWILVRLDPSKGDEIDNLCIIDEIRKIFIAIEDDDLYYQVKKRMLNEGIKIVSNLVPGKH